MARRQADLGGRGGRLHVGGRALGAPTNSSLKTASRPEPIARRRRRLLIAVYGILQKGRDEQPAEAPDSIIRPIELVRLAADANCRLPLARACNIGRRNSCLPRVSAGRRAERLEAGAVDGGGR